MKLQANPNAPAKTSLQATNMLGDGLTRVDLSQVLGHHPTYSKPLTAFGDLDVSVCCSALSGAPTLSDDQHTVKKSDRAALHADYVNAAANNIEQTYQRLMKERPDADKQTMLMELTGASAATCGTFTNGGCSVAPGTGGPHEVGGISPYKEMVEYGPNNHLHPVYVETSDKMYKVPLFQCSDGLQTEAAFSQKTCGAFLHASIRNTEDNMMKKMKYQLDYPIRHGKPDVGYIPR